LLKDIEAKFHKSVFHDLKAVVLYLFKLAIGGFALKFDEVVASAPSTRTEPLRTRRTTLPQEGPEAHVSRSRTPLLDRIAQSRQWLPA
jgi:hypothetical protein